MHSGAQTVQSRISTADKDYMTDHARDSVEFYLDINSTWKYQELIQHLRMSFESCEMFSSLLGDFYWWAKKSKET